MGPTALCAYITSTHYLLTTRISHLFANMQAETRCSDISLPNTLEGSLTELIYTEPKSGLLRSYLPRLSSIIAFCLRQVYQWIPKLPIVRALALPRMITTDTSTLSLIYPNPENLPGVLVFENSSSKQRLR